ncbi:MAG: type I-C CRISPR-associated protein Cas5 [Treponema sp.]|nr:type I-C CRISPR-associated protein Cas5 [Treponema sp.]
MKGFFDKTFCIEVWGDYACFTRPEMKVERVSYDVMTPSAARAIFEAIFWKPAICWKIKKIEVLNPIKWINLRRNEVGALASDSSNGIMIEEKRQQRAGLFLKDVRYRIHADLVFIPPKKRKEVRNPLPEYLMDSQEKGEISEQKLTDDHPNENPAKYNSMFERRAKKGQCFFQPYLGCREFSCFFKLVDAEKEPVVPILETRDLGFMLYDLDYSGVKNPDKIGPEDIKPAFFRAKIENGIIHIPDWDSEEVYK